VNDPAADDGEHRADLADLVFGDGEVVAVEHDDIAEPAHLQRAQLVLVGSAEEPAVRAGVEGERFVPGYKPSSSVDFLMNGPFEE